MNNPKVQANRHNNDPERKRPEPLVVLRANVMNRSSKNLIIARDAEMRQQQRAPKHSEVPFTTGYDEFLAKLVGTTAGNVISIDKNKVKDEEREHVVPAKISDHKVTSQPQASLDLDDDDQEMAADDFVLDAISADKSTEVSEMPNQPEELDTSERLAPVVQLEAAREATPQPADDKENDRIARFNRIAELRRQVADASKAGKEISNDLQKFAA